MHALRAAFGAEWRQSVRLEAFHSFPFRVHVIAAVLMLVHPDRRASHPVSRTTPISFYFLSVTAEHKPRYDDRLTHSLTWKALPLPDASLAPQLWTRMPC